jgi:hypothetical protein
MILNVPCVVTRVLLGTSLWKSGTFQDIFVVYAMRKS